MNGPFKHFYVELPFFGEVPITQTVISSCVVMLAICIGSVLVGRNLKKRPGKGQVVAEKLVTMLYDLVESTMGKHNAHWAPYIGALMLSSLGGSLIGMTGFLRSSTSDLSTTIVWALMTSFLVWGCSIRNSGFLNWLKGFAEPVLMLPLNVVGEIAQPISMAFRHFGNIMGGGVLMSLLYTALGAGSAALLGLVGSNLIVSGVVLVGGIALLVYAFMKNKLVYKILGAVIAVTGVLAILESLQILTGIPYLTLGIPGVLSLYFDIFSGGVQALVFSLLTMVYVGNACPPPEEKTAE